ncbi:MAG: TadE/TadG family type IV pilus assembly protein, partial [Dehalococcoidia bacterium]|nr:TadE/TadG family type IV pilus assembly protein [Dehalococcoidia bacterium]
MSQTAYKPSTKQGGQSLVEAAVLMPVLLLVLLGVLDLGRTFFAYVTVASAAREGARYASIHPSTSEDAVRQRVELEMAGTFSGEPGNLLLVQRSSLDVTDTITVTIRYSFTTMFLGPVSTLASHFGGASIIPNPIGLVAHAAIPISPGNYAADQANNAIATATAPTATAPSLPTSTPTQSPTITPTPSAAWVTLSSFTAFSLESLTVRGCNFHSNKTVNISWDGTDNWTASTDNGGCFGPVNFTVPASVSGSYHTVAARTQSGQQTLTGTAAPQLQIAATPTATATGTWTSTATATGTATATPTRTATATATPIPIVIYTMTEGDAFVSGTTAAGVTIEIRDMSAFNRPTIGFGTVGPSGVFSITVAPPLIADHMILLAATNDAVASGWVVQASRTATPTPSSTATGTATATSTATPTATAPTPQACTGTGLGGTVYAPGGSKLADVAVSLLLDGQVVNTTVTGGAGTYNFTTDLAGTGITGNRSYVISAVKSGYGSNWTAVYLPCGQSVTAPDITLSSATPTPTSTSSPPPSPALTSACTSQGSSYYHSLAWSSVSGATSYRVYEFNSTSSQWLWVLTVLTTSTDIPVSTNSIVRYYVTAVNSHYVESYPSNMVTAVCGSTPTPTSTPTRTATASATPTPYPDLYPISIGTDPGAESILTGLPVTVTVLIGNQGSASVN